MFIIFILTVYAALIIVFIIGWQRIPVFETENNERNNLKVSVVVACRNEEKNIPSLVESFRHQSLQNYELIFVNDHSTDNTLRLLQTFQTEFPEITIINSGKEGKKMALAEGIKFAQGDLVITTDADCEFGKDWLSVVGAFYLQNHWDLIIAPVIMTSQESLFENLQSIEFTSLVASGAGAAGVGHAIMCNGANLAFKKDMWMKAKDSLHVETVSGDDMFLLQFVKKQGGKIGYLKSEKAKVFTKPVSHLRFFFRQRTRWTGKSVFYTDLDIIFTAITVLLLSVAEVFFVFTDIKLFLLIFLFKLVLDCFFFLSIKKFFLPDFSPFNFVLASVLYPFYICLTVVLSLFGKRKRW
jgi:poly-beta-1,6-N-acetyl-D-glucosamine synthase